MTDPIESLARSVSVQAHTGQDSGPCGCWTCHAAVTPFHRGHCCFWPASNTCHPEFVEQWERDRDRLRGYSEEPTDA